MNRPAMTVAIAALMTNAMTAAAATFVPTLPAPICATLSSGMAKVTTTYATIELREFTIGNGPFQIWVQARGLGCASNADTKTTSSSIATKGAGQKSIMPYPGCGKAGGTGGAWGYATVDRVGTMASDGSNSYVGRVPLLINKSTLGTTASTTNLDYYVSNHYDYKLVTNINGDFTSFCAAEVTGNFGSGDSSNWTR